MKKHLKVNFIVDGNIVIDPKYQVEQDNNGFYNLIDTTNFKRKRFHSPPASAHKISRKNNKWEKIFEIKLCKIRSNSFSSGISEIMEERNTNDNTNNKPQIKLKSILKVNSTLANKEKRKVTYNNIVQYSYV